MRVSTAIIIILVLATIIQIVAMIFAVRLIRRTKFNVVWILCIIGFCAIFAERVCQMILAGDGTVSPYTQLSFGIITSLCMSAAVLFAYMLTNYIDRMERQRKLFNRRILTAVLRAEERSRSHFAKELHDGLGPLLSSAKMSISAVDKEGMDPAQLELYNNTSYVVDEAIKSLREISNNMTPQVLHDFGLKQGIKQFLSRSIALKDINVTFDYNLGQRRFENDTEVILYRVVCELVNNSLKHAKCSKINIGLNAEGSVITLLYSDNGRGFNPKAMMDCGMGLSNISSRINSLNGICNIESSAGKGMHATVTVGVGTSSIE